MQTLESSFDANVDEKNENLGTCHVTLNHKA